jgi:hypothetical protein
MNLAELTRQLHAVRAAGRPLRFIRLAHAALANIDHAPELAAFTLQALVEQGLGGPARELLTLHPEACPPAEDIDEWRQALAQLPNGRVSWSELRDTFTRNLAALRGPQPDLADDLAGGERLLRDLHLYRAKDGTPLIARRAPGALRTWLPPLATTELDATVELPAGGALPACALVGLRAGKTITTIAQRTARLFLNYSQPLYVLEPDPALLTAALHVADFADLLEESRLHWFVGADAVKRFEQSLAEHPRRALPQMLFDFTETADMIAALKSAVASAEAARRAATDVIRADLRTRSAQRTLAEVARRLQPPGPVLAVTSRYTTVLQYATRDALAALRRQGFETHLLIEEADDEQLTPDLIADAIARHDPAVVLCLDHLRYEFPDIPRDVPLITWIQDPLPNLMCPQAGASIGPTDLVCGILKPRCVREFGYPPDQFVTLEAPVALEVFHDGPVDDAERARYACDLCFVSNASTPIANLYAEALTQYPPDLHPLLTELYERVQAMLANGEFQHDAGARLTREVAAAHGLTLAEETLNALADYYTYRMLDWGRRQETLTWAADWARRTGRTFKLYGRGWENHPDLADCAAGVIDHGEPLRRALCAAKLAFQLIPSGIRHQRTYEVLACGTLPLNRYCPRDFDWLSITEFVQRRAEGTLGEGAVFFPGLERITFETREQFEAMAETYLGNPTARAEVVREMRQVVIERCTFDGAMRQVIEKFQENLNRAATAEAAQLNDQASAESVAPIAP